MWAQPSPLWWLPLTVRATQAAIDETFVVQLEERTVIRPLPQAGAWTVRVDYNLENFAIVAYTRKYLCFLLLSFLFIVSS